MNFIRTLKLILIDSVPDGRAVIELSNWTGKAFRIPRDYVDLCDDRPELMYTGVYFLFGKNHENNNIVYVGEAEQILPRLKTHVSEKNFWTQAVVFVSRENSLNKAHVKHLEASLFTMIKNANKYILINSNKPTKSSVSEAEYSEIQEFLYYIGYVTIALNFQIFHTTKEQEDAESVKQTYYISNTKGLTAKSKKVPEGFLVEKGSKASLTTASSYYAPYEKQRNRLIEQKILVQEGNFYIFTKNYLFKSASASASIVLGTTANGNQHWCRADGTLLKDI
ncbi:MAG: GIY-YIG nuclease family protein [Thermonemataceae bacterium]|nr:GIY-YIG nuclease family protein [Thermonemataceae bacterium]